MATHHRSSSKRLHLSIDDEVGQSLTAINAVAHRQHSVDFLILSIQNNILSWLKSNA